MYPRESFMFVRFLRLLPYDVQFKGHSASSFVQYITVTS